MRAEAITVLEKRSDYSWSKAPLLPLLRLGFQNRQHGGRVLGNSKCLGNERFFKNTKDCSNNGFHLINNKHHLYYFHYTNMTWLIPNFGNSVHRRLNGKYDFLDHQK